MSLANEVLDLCLDTKRILDAPPRTGTGNWSTWRSYIRLKWEQLTQHGSGSTTIVGNRCSYLDIRNLAHLFREIFIRRIYDVELDNRFPTIIDCGSNVGLSIMFFKDRYPNARVVGFEPSPLVFATLESNIAANHYTDVTLHQAAVCEHAGVVNLFVNPNEPGALNAGMSQTEFNSASVPVVAVWLSSYVTSEVDLVKLDVEGAEEEVLRELVSHGKLRRIRRFVIEYHHHHHRDPATDRLSVILSLLEGAGFGYQLDSYLGCSRQSAVYQDLLIYAYRKGQYS